MRLLVDVMCGGIVSYLRMCSYDTVYAGDHGRDLETDDAVLALAQSDGRTIVTRDVDLATRAQASILLESRDVEVQLAELAESGVELTLPADPARCGACNGPLERVDPDTPTPEYAPDPDDETCWQCLDCGQCFWKGSHWDRVRETLSRVTRGSNSDGDPSRRRQ